MRTLMTLAGRAKARFLRVAESRQHMHWRMVLLQGRLS